MCSEDLNTPATRLPFAVGVVVQCLCENASVFPVLKVLKMESAKRLRDCATANVAQDLSALFAARPLLRVWYTRATLRRAGGTLETVREHYPDRFIEDVEENYDDLNYLTPDGMVSESE